MTKKEQTVHLSALNALQQKLARLQVQRHRVQIVQLGSIVNLQQTVQLLYKFPAKKAIAALPVVSRNKDVYQVHIKIKFNNQNAKYVKKENIVMRITAA